MTARSEHERGLPPGLPRFLGRDSRRLGDLLGPSRRDRRLDWHRAPTIERAAVRERLRAAGESLDPVAQEDLLLEMRNTMPGWRLNTFYDALGPQRPVRPSLVYSALEAFSHGRDADAETDLDAVAARGERIAARAWEHTRRRLEKWGDLDDAGREESILRVFAVATVRDDRNVLIEAGRIAPALMEEFRDILEPPPPPPPEPVEDPIGEWARLSRRLEEVARKAAGPPPGLAALVEMQKLQERLHRIVAAVEDEIEHGRLRRLLDEVDRVLDELAADSDLDWFDDALRDEVREKWRATAGSFSDGRIEAERTRIAAGSEPALKAAKQAEAARVEAERRVVAKREERPRGALDRGDWRKSLVALQREEYRCEDELEDAQRALVAAVSPADDGPSADS